METITTAQADCKSNSTSRPDAPRDGGEMARPLVQSADVPLEPSALPDTEFTLAAIRSATLRARLAANELDSIGIALKRNLVSVEGALAWLHDVDLLDHVIYRPILDAH